MIVNAFSFPSSSPSLFRNDELVKLKGADITWDQISETGRPFFTITLTFRKTNQSDGNKGNRLSDFLLSLGVARGLKPREGEEEWRENQRETEG